MNYIITSYHYVIQNILKYSCQSILKIMGWSPLNRYCISTINNNQKMVCVFSHTSYYDFCIMVLYKLAYPYYFKNMKTLINSYYFTIMGRFLYAVGGIPAIVKEHNVKRIVDSLQQEQFMFLISPKGSILKKDWKTGYYYIAKQLNVPIIAVGLDYENKNIYIGKPINNQLEEPIIKNILYNDLSHIVPLHPEQENMIIRKHNADYVSVINPIRLICIYIGFLMYCVYK